MLLFILIVGVALANSNDLSTVLLATTDYSTCYGRFGSLACWGGNTFGQLGRGDDVESVNLASDAVAIDFGTSFVVKSIYGGGYHSCALSVEGCGRVRGVGRWLESEPRRLGERDGRCVAVY